MSINPESFCSTRKYHTYRNEALGGVGDDSLYFEDTVIQGYVTTVITRFSVNFVSNDCTYLYDEKTILI